MQLSEENFLLYAAKCYDNPLCYDTTEFEDDLKRFNYIRKLFKRFHEGEDLKERLILNHIVITFNCFGSHTTNMLFMKLEGYHAYLKPFLVFLDRMPDMIEYKNKKIHTSHIPMDSSIIAALRKI